jgi:hypothetical protein
MKKLPLLALLILVVFVLGLVNPISDRVPWKEDPTGQIKQNVFDMVEGLRTKNLTRVFRHVSQDFQRKGANKENFRRNVESVIDALQANHMCVSDPDVIVDRARGAAQVEFLIMRTEGATEFVRCLTKFIRDPDRQWRLKNIEVYLGDHELGLPF